MASKSRNSQSNGLSPKWSQSKQPDRGSHAGDAHEKSADELSSAAAGSTVCESSDVDSTLASFTSNSSDEHTACDECEAPLSVLRPSSVSLGEESHGEPLLAVADPKLMTNGCILTSSASRTAPAASPWQQVWSPK